MILSMTGYGKGTAGNNDFSIEIEVKSVNSRYLDLSLKLPVQLQSKEYEIREIIKNKIKRGKLSLTIQIRKPESGAAVMLNRQKLKDYIAQVKEVKRTAKLTEKIKLEHLLANRDIFNEDEASFGDEEFELVKAALNNALEQLFTMKKNEGSELGKDLKKRISIIEETLSAIEKESRASVQEYYEKLKEKVKALVSDTAFDKDRLELELAIIAEKAEITEECVRLRSHLKFFLDSLKGDDEPGRKLNFLCQEMNRETNTISSKAISTMITHNTVQIKEEIEKIREQIQNIE